MKNIKDLRQMNIFDPWGYLSSKRREMLDKSWAGLFQKELLSELPVKEVASFFKDNDFGRPTKELHTVLGALVLQQMHDLTDNETVNQFAFNIQWHYALNITEETDAAKYMCPKTLWTMRNRVAINKLDAVVFDQITDKLAKVFKVKTENQRLDSVHIKSNMRRLGRITIFTSSINKFLGSLERENKELFDSIDKGLTDKYLSEKAMQCFSMVKPSESAKTLASVSSDLFNLVERFKDHSAVREMESYKLLERVLKEQCTVSEDGTSVEVKTPKEIPSDSLQNPSDPDATYSGHKGQGYQVQVMETYCKDEDVKEETLNLITYVNVEPAHESDANAVIPAIESTQERGLAPEEILADTLYGSDENCQKALELGVEVVSPAKGAKEEISLSDFGVSEKGDIVSCPQGHMAVSTKTKNNRCTVAFDAQRCEACPFREACPVTPGKKYYYLRYTNREIRLAKRRAYEQTEEFKDRYRWRSGIEATMSQYDRKTGVKHLRVRGFKAVRLSATLKAVGVNIFRATVVQKAVTNGRTASVGGLPANISVIYLVKELFSAFWNQQRQFFAFVDRYFNYQPVMAA